MDFLYYGEEWKTGESELRLQDLIKNARKDSYQILSDK
jgi:hypothetical protein